MLAVLPNAPALIFPGKNMPLLKKKRDDLLRRLYRKGNLDREDLELAIAEPLPEKIYNTECIVPHVLTKAYKYRRGEVSRSTIDAELQGRVNEVINGISLF